MREREVLVNVLVQGQASIKGFTFSLSFLLLLLFYFFKRSIDFCADWQNKHREPGSAFACSQSV